MRGSGQCLSAPATASTSFQNTGGRSAFTRYVLVEEFLAFVRDGHGPSEAENLVLAEAIAARDAAEVAG